MMGLIPPDRVPWRLLASFALLVLLPAGAVVWLGIYTVIRDAERESNRLQRQAEQAANRYVQSTGAGRQDRIRSVTVEGLITASP